jgi:hypothetical protein
MYLVKRTLMGTILLSLVIAGGCRSQHEGSKNDEAAIHAAIQRHLGLSGVNINAITQETKKISINGDQALVDMDFRLKNGDPKFGMSVEYVLQRSNGQWEVVRNQPVGGNHGPAAGQSSSDNK